MTRERLLAVLLLFVGGWSVALITIPVWQSQALGDDVFITLTYAKNLAAGNGFVFNHPPATLGTTTPLNTLLLALLARILPFFDVVEVSILFSAACWIGTAPLLYLLLLRLGVRPVAGAAAAVLSIFPGGAWTRFFGMEIWLFQLLLVAAILLAVIRRPLLAGLCVGALFLTRGEGALLGASLLVYVWIRERRFPSRYIVGASVVLVVWVVYALLTFDAILPNTLAAKRAQSEMGVSGGFLSMVLLKMLPNYLDSFRLFGVRWINPFGALAVLGVFYAWRRLRVMLLFPLWALLYLLGYAALDPSPYDWYVLNLCFVLQVLAGLGLCGLITGALGSGARRIRMAAALGAASLGAAMLYLGFVFVVWEAVYFGDYRAPAYKAVAGWLREHTDPDESVAFVEVGYVGYYSDNRIVDLAGVTDPEITRHLASDGFAWGFWHYQPDYYIDVRDFDWALRDALPGLADYVTVHEIVRVFPRTPIRILRRRVPADAGSSPPLKE